MLNQNSKVKMQSDLKLKIFGNIKIFFYMREKKFPKSIRKYIRKEKARIRREILDLKEQQKQINELYKKIFEKFKIKTKEENKILNQIISKNLLIKEKK